MFVETSKADKAFWRRNGRFRKELARSLGVWINVFPASANFHGIVPSLGVVVQISRALFSKMATECRPFVASRARLTVSLSRAAAYSPRIYFRSLELVEGQWQARWRVDLAPTRVSLVNAVSCIKRGIFSWARTEEGEEKQKQLGSNDKRANELTFRYWNSLQITSSRK